MKMYIYSNVSNRAVQLIAYDSHVHLVSKAGVPTKHATYQIVLPIIYLYYFKGKFKVRVGVDG